MKVEEAYKVIDSSFEPRTHQKKVWDELAENSGPGILLRAGTGAGKTESFLIPAIFMNIRTVMVYPARSLVEDQVQRAIKYVKRYLGYESSQIAKTVIFDLGDKKFALKISTWKKSHLNLIKQRSFFWEGLKGFRGVKIKYPAKLNKNSEGQQPLNVKFEEETFKNIQNALEFLSSFLQEREAKFSVITSYGKQIRIEIKRETGGRNSFYIEKTNRHYYRGDIILTSLDKFIYRFFGYGEKDWNLLYPYRLIFSVQNSKNSTNRTAPLIVFDEAHSYKGTAFTNFKNLVSSLVANGINVGVMSATLPDNLSNYLQEHLGLIEINGGDYKGQKSFKWEKNWGEEDLIEFISKNKGKKIIVVKNTVGSAFNLFKKLKEELPDCSLYLYHGRQFDYIKERTYNELKKKDGLGEPYILITTHAIEVGVDLNAEIMISDFANPDQIIQRGGRCARKKDTKGDFRVMGSSFSNNEQFLYDEETYDYDKYKEILSERSGKELNDEVFKGVIHTDLREDDLTSALFQYLYSYVYDFDRTREQLHQSGFVATRSWVPSANIFLVKDNIELEELKGELNEKGLKDVLNKLKEDNRLYNNNPLKISLLSLGQAKPLKVNDVRDKVLVVAVSNPGSPTGINKSSLINPYLSEIYVFINSQATGKINPEWGLVRVPRVFEISRSGLKTQVVIGDNVAKYISMVNYKQRIEFLEV